jgi:hypothetical protein
MSKNIYDGTTSVLNISGNEIDDNCLNVIEFLKSSNIFSNVISNKTIFNNQIENGCKITLSGLNPIYIEEKVWFPLERMLNIKCAHLEITRNYSGCIQNFIKKSECNQKNKNT